ncbi:MAG TPA: right-handed parallel beta-helix repeat-containing protein, partial [Thermoanaerobaculia bacterium]|nr:right-handed parallel beta-helix repeat-containing protein [Thermoanaerobaculia bacterium]
ATTAELNSASALSAPGDLILVQPGTYTGVNLVNLSPGSTLVSAGGADATILEVSQFVVNMSDVVIDGFTFRASSTLEPLNVAGSNNVHLRDCRILAPDTGYGLRITDAQNLLIERTVFQGYAGILLRSGNSSGTLTLRNNQFLTQTFGVTGGLDPALQVTLENNLFKNLAREAVDLEGIAALTTRNNLFVGNGTGLYLSSIPGSVQLTQDTLVGNGVGYELLGTLSAVLYNAIFQGNNRGIDGGANATASVHNVLHWQDTSWLYGSVNYILNESTILQADPRFVNAAGGDYHLAAASPAHGAGQGGVDLGAYGGALGNSWITPPGAPPAPPALLSIAITGPDRANPGDTLIATAKAAFANGYVSAYTTFTNVAQWSSSDSTVLQSQGAGHFLALRPGTAVVTARSGGVSTNLSVTVLAPMLQIAVTDTVDPAAAGGLLTDEIAVTNVGAGTARHLQVTAQLDSRTSLVSASPMPDAGTINRWTSGDLQPGQTARISVVLRVDPAALGAILTFSASAAADFATSVATSETTAVAGTPDLQIAASLTPAAVGPGGLLTGSLTYRNAGSAPARNAVVEANYPSGMVFRSATPAPSSGTGTWFVGDLAPGQQGTISLGLQAAMWAAGTQVFSAEIRSGDADLAPADNTASASTAIVAASDLAIAATSLPDPGRIGQPLTYELTLTNQGPSEATGISVVAQLPAGFAFLSAVPDQGSCSAGSPLVCQLGSLAANASTHLAVSGTPMSAGTLQMVSTVSANEADPAMANNRWTATTEVLPAGPPGLLFYTLTPCRLLDTRSNGPALASGGTRIVQVAGICGIPADAVAVSVNMTAVAPSAAGFITLFPGNLPLPATSSINFPRGSTRTNNAILPLASDASGTLAAQAFLTGSGRVDLILDVNGYFR